MKKIWEKMFIALAIFLMVTNLAQSVHFLADVKAQQGLSGQGADLSRFAFVTTETVDIGYFPTSIAVDSQNRPHIGYPLKHAYFNGSSWIIQTINDSGESPSLALDSQDRPHLSYTSSHSINPYMSARDIKYAYYNGSSWVIQFVREGTGSTEYGISDICVDSKNNPHVVYYGRTERGGSNPTEAFLEHAYYNGSSWAFQKIDNYTGLNTIWYPSIAIDSNDKLHVAYLCYDKLRYAYFDGVSWSVENVDDCIAFVSIAVDSENNPHVVYRKTTTGLNYAYYNGTSWNTETISGTTDDDAYDASIAVNSHNYPLITYLKYADASDRSLKYAYYDGAKWSVGIIEGGANVGWGSSASFDSNDDCHVSYIYLAPGGEVTAPELEYAFGTAQFLTNLTFQDNSGAPLYTEPTEIQATAKNGRLATFTSFSNQWLDKGTWILDQVKWQGNNVETLTEQTYNSTAGGTWTINTRVYNVNVKNKDDSGNLLTKSVTLTFPNGTSIIKQSVAGWINMSQIQNGTITIGTPIAVSGSERYVLLNSTSITVTGNTIVDSVIWRHETTTIKVSCDSSVVFVGFYVNVTGELMQIPTGALPSATVILTYRVPGVSVWNLITSTLTKSDGTYSVIWSPSATGYYTINASWAGNDQYLGASDTIDLAVVPYKDEYVFSVVSNSTLSSLTFDSTKGELSFTASGPSGTTGYINVTISKTLISNVADIKVYLDGEAITYTTISKDNSWLIHFTYQHSSHNVKLSLGPIFIPPQLITSLTIIVISLCLAIATAAVILKMRKGPPTVLNGVFHKPLKT